MLRTTPGVASNFGNELGSGLASAVPAISNSRMQDRDFWTKIAELQAQRGTLASLPAKMDVAQSDKEIEDLTHSQARLRRPAFEAFPPASVSPISAPSLKSRLNASARIS